ncbi:hypothetical protein GGI25_002387 [Coemansia spiralis]|uniref:Ubiquitin carboxyl-terminal hydrolase n=1 Tax=Coemansia spiralis TaxID=417178 RepID=A0A9W8KZ42_9FUNG|nr:hypothetical protein GGI25_002387 [Coemansia spiralis]
MPPPSWSAIAKSGIPHTTAVPVPHQPQPQRIQSQSQSQSQPQQKEQPPANINEHKGRPHVSKANYAEGVSVRELETKITWPSIRFGELDITIDNYTNDAYQLPFSIPPDTDFWIKHYMERRRRKEEKRNRNTQAPPPLSAQQAEPQVTLNTESSSKPISKPSNWAALLKPSRNGSASAPAVQLTVAGGATNGAHAYSDKTNGADSDSPTKQRKFKSLTEALENWSLVFDSPLVQPRGLVNTGNMCFMSVVLQALLYCAPFYNMLWSIKENVAFSFKANTPLLEALIQYVYEFKQDKTPLAQLETELEEPFVPENIYEALRKKNVFQTLRGQQEDAQEFMGYLVDGIHEEMVNVMLQQKQGTCAGAVSGDSTINSKKNDSAAKEDSDWLEVGPNNKATYVRDADQLAFKTPITRIFGGTIRSTLTVPHAADPNHLHGYGKKPPQSSNRESFRCLLLDISSPGISTIEDAFDELVAPETIEGYTNVLGQSVNASKQTLLERAPPVLVLYLKRFIFCHDEGTQKLHKYIEYPQVLALLPRWFAKSAEAAKYQNAKYKLCSVIYHHGSHASGGHYTCDLLRSANEWLRFDDVDIRSLDSVDEALDEKKDRTAYILFYTICH